MNDQTDNVDMLFYSLIISLQGSAMQYLGKIMNPATGKIERNLDAAKHSIDMLEMIQRKTSGNLSDDEKQTLQHMLYELRLNYVDESKKPEEPADSPKTEDESGENEAGEKADNNGEEDKS